MSIYVVSYVTYDYYRFEEVLYASTKLSKCKEFIKNHENHKMYGEKPTLFYNVNNSEDDNHGYKSHFWIAEFDE